MRGRYFILFFMALGMSLALASATNSQMCAEAFVNSINPSSVDANQEFTVGIEIDNCGEIIPQNVIFEITRISPEISVQEPLINNIGEIGYANSKRFVLYHMRTAPNIQPGIYHIESKLTYGDSQFRQTKDYNFSITVETNAPELSISGSKTAPDRISPKDDIILTVKVENSGKGSAKSVRVRLEGLDFEGVKEAYIGEIKSDEELPARFVLRAGDTGTSNFNVKIFYKFGDEDKLVQYPMSLQVFSKSNLLWWLIPGILVLVIVISFLVLRTNHNNEDEE